MGASGVNLPVELRQFIIENFLLTGHGANLGDLDSLTAHGILDSTGVMELVLHLQERYGIKVLDEELHPDNFDSIGKIAAYIERKQAEETQ